MAYHGDYALSKIVNFKFTTHDVTGAPTTLAGTPVVKVYKSNDTTTESTAGVTLTVDFDGKTGCHHVNIDTSADAAFYLTATDFDVIITTGTVGGTSVIGYVVGSFSIENRSGLRPTTSGRTLDVSSGGEAGLDWANVGSPTTALNLSGTSTKAVEPTVAGRTLDVATTGEAGLDFDNVKDASAGHTLTNITVPIVTTLTGHTPQTGDNYVRIGAPVGVSISADIAEVENDVDLVASGIVTVIGGVTVTTNNDKTGYTLTGAYDPAKTASQAGDAMALTSGERTTLTAAIWAALTVGLTTVGSVGKKLADWVMGTDSRVLLSADAQTGVVLPHVTLVDTVTDVTNDVEITQAGADKVWSADRTVLFPVDTFGELIAPWQLGTDGKALLSTDSQAGVTIPTVTDVTNTVDANVVSTAGHSIPTGTIVADVANTTSHFLTDLTGLDPDVWRYALLVFTNGDDYKQVRQVTISAADGFITVHEAFTQVPADGDTFWLINR